MTREPLPVVAVIATISAPLAAFFFMMAAELLDGRRLTSLLAGSLSAALGLALVFVSIALTREIVERMRGRG